MTERKFPSPFRSCPAECEGWEEMYPRHALFANDRRAFEESRFWFQEGLHWPEPIYPFDTMVVEARNDAFPDVADQAIATLVAGGDLLPLRPDEELKRLAELAVELEVTPTVKAAADEARLRSALEASEPGKQWLASLERAKEPWFYFSYGNGLANHYRSWIDDTSLPLATIASYIERLESGEAIFRSDERVAEPDRITSEYRALLPEAQREAFDERIALARTVCPYVENHSFYIDHWYFTIFWNKVRE